MSKEEYEKKLNELKQLLDRGFDADEYAELENLFKRLKEKSKPNNFRRDSFSFSKFDTIIP